MNLFNSVLTALKTFYSKEGWPRLAIYAALVVFVLLQFIKCDGTKKEVAQSAEDCTPYVIENDSLRQLLSVKTHLLELAPKGDTIEVEKLLYHTTFVKTWKEKEYWQKLYEEKEKAYADVLIQLTDIKEEDFDKSGQWFSTVTEQLPIVETIRQDSSANHKLTLRIISQGELKGLEKDLQVFPTILEKKGDTKYLKDNRKNLLAPGVGGLRFAGQWYPVYSITYGRSFVNVTLGAVANDKWKPKGINDFYISGQLVYRF